LLTTNRLAAFKKDIDALILQVGKDANLVALRANVVNRYSPARGKELRRLVDRIDEKFADNSQWRNIRTAYKLHGTKFH